MSKNKSNITNNKKWLIVGATTIAFGSLFSCSGSSGGGSYKPGQQVTVKSVVDDPSGGNYTVTLGSNEAKVGEKYHTEINLTPKNAVNDEYVLPDKLVSIISNTTALKEEQYKYTLGESKTTAELDIEGEFVYGPINISLVLVSTSQPGPTPEEWVDIEDSDAVAIASRLYELFDKNQGQLSYLLRKNGSQGEYTSHLTSSGMDEVDAEYNLTFDFRNKEPDAIDKDVYLKREYIDNVLTSTETYYDVYLPNTKKDSVEFPGIYKFLSTGTVIPTLSNNAPCSIDRPYTVEEIINRDDTVTLFNDEIPPLLLIGGSNETPFITFIPKLFDPGTHPEDVVASFQSKNESSLRGSCSGTFDYEISPSNIAYRTTIDIKNIVVDNYIVTNIDATATINVGPGISINGALKADLEYKEIVNEYDPSWPITI